MSNESPTGQDNLVSIPADWAKPVEPEAPPEGARIVELTDAARSEVKRLIAEEGSESIKLETQVVITESGYQALDSFPFEQV